MEANRDEAERAKELALKKLEGQDYSGAAKVLLRAEKLYPKLDGLQQLFAIVNVHTKAQNKVGLETDWYGILEVETTADDATIKKQYKKLAFHLHPDKNKSVGAEAAFKLVGEAFGILSDKTKRSKHDLLRNKVPLRRPFPTPAPVTPTFIPVRTASPHSNSFWTVCPHCRLQFQYQRCFLNCRLLCDKCKKDFVARELQRANANGVNLNGGRGFNFSNVGAFQRTGVPPQATPSSTMEFVKQAMEHVKKERKDKEKVEKQKRQSQKTAEDHVKRKGPMPETVKKEENGVGQQRTDHGQNPESEKSKAKPESNGESSKQTQKVVDIEEDEIHVENGVQTEQPTRRSSRKRNNAKYIYEDDDLVEFGPRKKMCTPENSGRSVDEEVSIQEVEQRIHEHAYDFDGDRTLSNVEKDQFWAIYDDSDGMPRWYGRVEEVKNEEAIKVRWLEAVACNDDEKDWLVCHYLACGQFKLMKRYDWLSLKTFGHLLEMTPLKKKAHYQVYPARGEVWAMFHGWNRGWLKIKSQDGHEDFSYVPVLVLEDYSEENGVLVVRLKKVGEEGHVFTRGENGKVERVLGTELFRFSHRIPAVRHQDGQVPSKSWELDRESSLNLVESEGH